MTEKQIEVINKQIVRKTEECRKLNCPELKAYVFHDRRTVLCSLTGKIPGNYYCPKATE